MTTLDNSIKKRIEIEIMPCDSAVSFINIEFLIDKYPKVPT